MSNPRTIKGCPFAWQSKAALRKIREAFDATHTVDSALVVYLALSEIASDKGEERFQTTHSWIASRCGVSIRTVASRLRELDEIKLISIETPALRAPSTITLLHVLQPLQNDMQPLPDVLQREKNRSLQTYKEPERKIEEPQRKAGADFSGDLQPVKDRLGAIFKKPPGDPWTYAEEYPLSQVVSRPSFGTELSEIEGAYRKSVPYLSQSLARLLTDWGSNLDKARNTKTPGGKTVVHDCDQSLDRIERKLNNQ